MELWEREDLAAARDAGVEFWPGQRVSVGTLPGVVVLRWRDFRSWFGGPNGAEGNEDDSETEA